jgi:hypothetical protein
LLTAERIGNPGGLADAHGRAEPARSLRCGRVGVRNRV